jgi:hypothetical protein
LLLGPLENSRPTFGQTHFEFGALLKARNTIYRKGAINLGVVKAKAANKASKTPNTVNLPRGNIHASN